MDPMFFVDFILHVDKYISLIIQNFGVFSYLIIFLIIFCETGLVVTPFLPGDSLLFVLGAFAARGDFNIFLLALLLPIAALLGDNVNYWIGRVFGEKAFSNSRFFKKEYLEKTKDFYKKHGGTTIILARFIPIIRTFSPFVAGIGKMDYVRFLSFSVIAALVWVGLFTGAGYLFGNFPFVENNLTLLIYVIVFLSILPGIISYIKHKMKKN
jgi:membrane-associated protein